MRKSIKRVLILTSAAVLALGATGLTACNKKFKPLTGDYSSDTPAVSNGGFVVEYGNYVYFINGAESYEADNTYGKPVKGALMRVKKGDVTSRSGQAETVVPSLMVSGDTDAGVFIYGDRVYYATPNNTKSMSGEVEKDYLDFKSAKLDGSDVKSYFRLSDNSTSFRYVEAGADKAVYLVYYSDSTLYSYNTASKKETTLAKNVSAYVFDSSSKSNLNATASTTVYYTMSVSDNIDTNNPQSKSYNQIYRVDVDVTEAPEAYDYEWNEDYLDAHDGVAPYVNLGTLVLDGVNTPTLDNDVTRFTHDYKKGESEPLTPNGYTYTLIAHTNGGIYFTRKENTNVEISNVYYLSESSLKASGWNTITGNAVATGKLDEVASHYEKDNVTASALYFFENGKQNYVYVEDSNIVRATVENGVTTTQEICRDASGAELVCLDDTDPNYHYVWFTRSSGSGYSVERAVYNGTAEDYETLGFIGESGERDNSDYMPVKLLDLQHKTSWYRYEVIPSLGAVFIADAEAVGSTSYDYVANVSIKGTNGNYLTNSELEEINDKYDAIKGTDSKNPGYIAKVGNDNSALSNAYTYFFMTGETDIFDENIQNAVDLGKKETYLYTKEEQEAFKSFADGTAEDIQDIKAYRVRTYFINPMGVVNEADQTAMDSYWSGYLKNYTESSTQTSGLKGWEWALIGIAIGIVVIGGGVGVYFYLRHRKKSLYDEKPERMKVDTTDDRDLDVYDKAFSEATVEEGDEAREDEEPATEAPAEGEPESSEAADEPVSEEHGEPKEPDAPEEPDTPEEPDKPKSEDGE